MLGIKIQVSISLKYNSYSNYYLCFYNVLCCYAECFSFFVSLSVLFCITVCWYFGFRRAHVKKTKKKYMEICNKHTKVVRE